MYLIVHFLWVHHTQIWEIVFLSLVVYAATVIYRNADQDLSGLDNWGRILNTQLQ